MAPHLELAELEQRYRQATDRVARSQWQLIWLLAQGQSTQSVVQTTGYSATCLSSFGIEPISTGGRSHLITQVISRI